MKAKASPVRLSFLVFGFAFLYIPILSLVFYSFNRSRLVTVWGGFSTEWYGRLFENTQILDAAWLSLRVAAINATGATILGTLAGLALARFGRFRGRTLFTGMITAPLVMPEVITSPACRYCCCSWPPNRLSAGPKAAASAPSPSPT
jgi:putrescine transport system permease protein